MTKDEYKQWIKKHMDVYDISNINSIRIIISKLIERFEKDFNISM